MRKPAAARWTDADIPDQTGRTAVVTGANTGIGFETARMLARAGASVVLACRDPEKGAAAVRTIRAEKPAGSARFAPLDLADLDSVAAFAGSFAGSFGAGGGRLDLLVNNAGVMVPPLGRTKQGSSSSSARTTSATSPSPGACCRHWSARPARGSSW